jgi:AcrR family transcriptional regulator
VPVGRRDRTERTERAARIFDVAEEALRGIGAERLMTERDDLEPSLREITSGAGANVAAVNYHFGSKDALIHASSSGPSPNMPASSLKA